MDIVFGGIPSSSETMCLSLSKISDGDKTILVDSSVQLTVLAGSLCYLLIYTSTSWLRSLNNLNNLNQLGMHTRYNDARLLTLRSALSLVCRQRFLFNQRE